MKEFRKSIFIAIILMSFGMTAPFAAGLNEICTTEKCDTDLFCSTGAFAVCQKCPGDYPSSDAGTTSESQCYKQISCPDSTDVVPNGTIKPDKASIKNFNEKTTTKECTYTKRENLTCNDSFHLEPNSNALACISNCKKCNIRPHANSADKALVTGTGCQWWLDKDKDYSNVCRDGVCNEGYHLIYTASSKSYCNPNTIDCKNWPIYLTTANGGNAVYDYVDTNEAPKGENTSLYDTSQCYQNQEYTSASGNGSGKQKCFHTSGFSDENVLYTTECEITEINSCNAGYYYDNVKNPADCIPTDQGYYSPALSIAQSPCPVGMTSATPATAKTECFYQGKIGGTKFCDDNGCFNLPDNVHFGN